MPEPQNPIKVLWERLRAAPPQEVAARARVAYDAEQKAYRVPLCGRDHLVRPAEEKVEGPEGFPGYEAMLICVQYLLTARGEPPAGDMVDPKSLPYGDFFFRGPHPMPTDRLEAAFGESLDAFRRAAEALGGRPVEMGDAAYEFLVLPRVPVTVILWAADDEFPARAQFLLDRWADHHFPLDALWVLCRLLAKLLVSALP